MRNFDLTVAAEEDLRAIWRHTYETWGVEQADRCSDLIVACCEGIARGDALTNPAGGLSGEVRVHRCEQHYIFFLPGARPAILAILHGQMDLLRRLGDRI